MRDQTPSPETVLTSEAETLLTDLAYELCQPHHDTPAYLETFKSRATGYNLEYINHGTARITFRIPSKYINSTAPDDTFVVKLPFHGSQSTSGHVQNKNELTLYNTPHNNIKKFLLPITDYDPDAYWLVFPEATAVTKNDTHVKLFTQEAHRNGLPNEDTTTDNIGLWQSDYYYIDYGHIINDGTDTIWNP